MGSSRIGGLQGLGVFNSFWRSRHGGPTPRDLARQTRGWAGASPVQISRVLGGGLGCPHQPKNPKFAASPPDGGWRDPGSLDHPSCSRLPHSLRDNDTRKSLAEWFGWGQVTPGVNTPCPVRQGGGGGEDEDVLSACKCLRKANPPARGGVG